MGLFVSFGVEFEKGSPYMGNTELSIEDFNGIEDVRAAENMIKENMSNGSIVTVVITGWKRFGT